MASSWASDDRARRTMRANRRKDTGPELKIRTILHRRGLRYRVDFAPVKGVRRKADLVFTRVKLAVFVDGCFWHGCPEHFIPPKTNQDYWDQKISGNRSRDADTNSKLESAGWTVLRFWEHADPEEAADTIMREWQALRTPHG